MDIYEVELRALRVRKRTEVTRVYVHAADETAARGAVAVQCSGVWASARYVYVRKYERAIICITNELQRG